MEVVIEYAVVEQQLYVVFLHCLDAVGRIWPFDEHVASRLLLDEQLQIGGHQVHTSLDAELLTDKGRFENRVIHVEVAAQFRDGLLQVPDLHGGIVLEAACVEVCAGAILQCFLPKIVAQRLGSVEVWIVDDVVECTAGKVSEQDRLGVGFGLHAADEVEKWRVTILHEAGCDRADVEQEVRLYDDDARIDVVSFHLTVQQIEMHAFFEDRSQVAHVGVLVVLAVVNRHR